MATNPISGASSSNGQTPQNDALRGLDMDQFLKLMIAELQNQDPLNPMENTDILQQISQIRDIGATGQLTDTLSSILTGQSLASASAMIGKEIEGLTDEGDTVTGVVERVTIANGEPKLHIGDDKVGLRNVKTVLGAPVSTDG